MGALASLFFPSNAELCQNVIDGIKKDIYLRERESKRALNEIKKLHSLLKSCLIIGEKKIIIRRIQSYIDRHLKICEDIAKLEKAKMDFEDLKNSACDVDSIQRETELLKILNIDIVETSKKMTRNSIEMSMIKENVTRDPMDEVSEMESLEIRLNTLLLDDSEDEEQESVFYVLN